MDTNLYWQLRGSYSERNERLKGFSREFLEASILDAEYNDFLRHRSDFGDKDEDPHGHGKRLPYIGWYWRHLEFSDGRLPIGRCGSFVGFMANNKWDYPERSLTEEEFSSVMEIIDEAMRLDQQGGELSKIIENTNNKLAELWPLLQTFKI